jgi:hypothetical protein
MEHMPQINKEKPKDVNMELFALGNTRFLTDYCPQISPDTVFCVAFYLEQKEQCVTWKELRVPLLPKLDGDNSQHSTVCVNSSLCFPCSPTSTD